MSRTDKDKPHWVRATAWKAEHFCDDYGHRVKWPYWNRRRDCDLPEFEYVDPRLLRKSKQWRGQGHCSWQPVWDRRSHATATTPPKWFIDRVWNNVERRRERDDLGKLRREYNANRGVDDGDFGCWQPRGAKWLWD